MNNTVNIFVLQYKMKGVPTQLHFYIYIYTHIHLQAYTFSIYKLPWTPFSAETVLLKVKKKEKCDNEILE